MVGYNGGVATSAGFASVGIGTGAGQEELVRAQIEELIVLLCHLLSANGEDCSHMKIKKLNYHWFRKW